MRLLAALPGFYVVVRRFLRDKTDPLALMLVGALAIYAYGAVVDNTNFGRVLPLILFPAHVGIGLLVAEWIEHRSRPRLPVVVWLGVSVGDRHRRDIAWPTADGAAPAASGLAALTAIH